jgi:hypothetical protein
MRSRSRVMDYQKNCLVAAHPDVMLRSTLVGLWNQYQWVKTAPTHPNKPLNLN